jgi:BRO family, N-terminal domain
MDPKKAIKLFNDQKIRVQWEAEEEKWYFSIVDVVGVLAENDRPRKYWSDLKRKLQEEGSQLSEKIGQLKMPAADGKMRLTDVADTEQLLRIIQSIPSPNAEPFKVWLARVGYERIEETEDPEKTIERAMDTYLKKGYSPQWVNQRLKSIEVRKELTDEWQHSGVQKGKEYAILTNEITEAWSGHTVKDYKRVKGLKKENLRDNMSNLELVLNMLAEATTAEISKEKQPKGFDASKRIARQGGRVAGNTRKEIEERTGRPVVTSKNARDLLEDSNNEALESGEENE